MHKFTSKAALTLSCGLALVSSQAILAADAGTARSGARVEEVIIKAIRADRDTRGATGLDLSPFETPQSLTVLDAEQIANFRLVDVNAALQGRFTEIVTCNKPAQLRAAAAVLHKATTAAKTKGGAQ